MGQSKADDDALPDGKPANEEQVRLPPAEEPKAQSLRQPEPARPRRRPPDTD